MLGMLASSVVFAFLLEDFSSVRLIKVIQGAAAASAILNIVALWKQEARNPQRTAAAIVRPTFSETWRGFAEQPRTMRFFLALGMGTAAFSMQDVILEPYGGEVLGLSVSATTVLTALMAAGALAAFVLRSEEHTSELQSH